MRPNQLVLRCYAERHDDLWLAFCLDFSLGVQGDSLEEVRSKLESQIQEYVHDALVGEDRAHAEYLLTRRAPLSHWLTYWAIRIEGKLARMVHARRQPEARPFHEVMPIAPAHC